VLIELCRSSGSRGGLHRTGQNLGDRVVGDRVPHIREAIGVYHLNPKCRIVEEPEQHRRRRAVDGFDEAVPPGGGISGRDPGLNRQNVECVWELHEPPRPFLCKGKWHEPRNMRAQGNPETPINGIAMKMIRRRTCWTPEPAAE
jgi:hypothetical protein